MGGEKGWRWRAGLCHAMGVVSRKSGVGRERVSDTCADRTSDPGNCPPVIAAIASLLRRGRFAPLRRSLRILSVTRWAPEAVPDLADPDPLFAPAQYGAKGFQLGVI